MQRSSAAIVESNGDSTSTSHAYPPQATDGSPGEGSLSTPSIEQSDVDDEFFDWDFWDKMMKEPDLFEI